MSGALTKREKEREREEKPGSAIAQRYHDINKTHILHKPPVSHFAFRIVG